SGADGRVSPAPPPDWDDWLASLTAAQNATLRVSAVSASGLEGTEPAVALNSERDDDEVAGSAKGARDVDLPPWSKGRYGSAIGRAVHGVLQTVDLSDGSGIEAAVSAQCIAEGVVEFSDVVAALVRSALDSDLVKRAAVREHWRESYVATVRADGTVVEGIADLIYREDDGSLVVVDYKTDAVPAAALSARAAFYAPQIEAYTSALRDASQSAVRAQLLFLHPTAPAQPV
ncbi:MAG: PD-(D/E)XK nuclease family protein, partial [Nocardioidaceae bacterium]|nr:PD-(D/E)XK nuclease family protein [Nocardioidaceae bacterium]